MDESMFISLVIIALSFMNGTVIWILFESPLATIITIIFCVLFSVIATAIIWEAE